MEGEAEHAALVEIAPQDHDLVADVEEGLARSLPSASMMRMRPHCSTTNLRASPGGGTITSGEFTPVT